MQKMNALDVFDLTQDEGNKIIKELVTDFQNNADTFTVFRKHKLHGIREYKVFMLGKLSALNDFANENYKVMNDE